MDPITSSITSFGISVAAGIVTNKLSQAISVDKEINQAFKKAKNDWSQHDLSNKKEQELKQYLESAYNSPLFVNDSKGNEAEDFFNKFRKRLSQTMYANNFLKEIVDENRFQEVITSIQRVEYKLDNLTALLQNLSIGEVQLTNDRIKEICQPLIQEFKPQSALSIIDKFEKYISDNPGNITASTRANIFYLKSVCYEALGNSNESHVHLVKAYNEAPDNLKYLEKVCSSYFVQNNNKYEELLDTLEKTDEYNPRLWVIKVLQSDNVINCIQNEVPLLVKEKIEFKRILFDRLIKRSGENVRDEIEAIDISSLRIPVLEFITYDSFFHWLLIFNYLIDAAIFSQPQLRFVGFLDKNEDVLYFFQVVKMLNKNLGNTELKIVDPNIFSFYEHWLESEINNSEESVLKLNDIYLKLSSKNSIYAMLLANTLQKYGHIDEARKIINEFEGVLHSQIMYLKTFIDLSSQDQNTFKDGAIYFLENEKKVNENNLFNYCDFLSKISARKVLSKEQILGSITKLEVSNPDFKKLFELIVETDNNKGEKVPVKSINSLKTKFTHLPALKHQIAIFYFLNNYFDDCISYIESFVDDSNYSLSLGLYIQSLQYAENSDKINLFKLLKQWRVNNYPINIDFLRYELHYSQVLLQWNEVIEITDYALRHFPKEGYFYISLLNALDNCKNKDRISKEVNTILNYKFSQEEWCLRAGHILLKYGYKEESIDLFYREAQDKENSDARMNYLSVVTTTELSEFLEQYNTVKEGYYVTYEVNEQKEIIHILGSKKKLPIVQESLGKQLHDIVSFKKKIGSMFSKAKIIRIGNKHLALFDEIMKDSDSINSETPLLSFKLEDSNIESLNKVFIENFAVQEEGFRKNRSKNLSDYYSYNIPFSVLVSANYNHSYIDAYLNLTSDKGFLVKPIQYLPNALTDSTHKIVIDFSSGMLLFNMSKKIGLKYLDKFLISSNIYNFIDNLIIEAELSKNSKASVEIHLDKVVPHFYDDSFSSNRINYLNEIKSWFLNNCIPEIPVEKLNFHNKLQNSEVFNPCIELLADYLCFAQREDTILITDDLALFQKIQPQNVISSEKYLKHHFPEKLESILEQMLDLKYIGVSLNESVLYNAFINQHKQNKKHIYSYALRNVGLRINYRDTNVDLVINFLRKLALNPSIDRNKYKQVATNVFIMLVKSIPNISEASKIQDKIHNTFRLFTEHEFLTLNALISALQIINRS